MLDIFEIIDKLIYKKYVYNTTLDIEVDCYFETSNANKNKSILTIVLTENAAKYNSSRRSVKYHRFVLAHKTRNKLNLIFDSYLRWPKSLFGQKLLSSTFITAKYANMNIYRRENGYMVYVIDLRLKFKLPKLSGIQDKIMQEGLRKL